MKLKLILKVFIFFIIIMEKARDGIYYHNIKPKAELLNIHPMVLVETIYNVWYQNSKKFEQNFLLKEKET